MTQDIISALCDCHANLSAAQSDTPSLPNTMRQIEKTIVEELNSMTEEERIRCLFPVLNSGSMKALRKIPTQARISKYPVNGRIIDTGFVLRQDTAYIRAAIKHGLEIPAEQALNHIQTIEESASPRRPNQDDLFKVILSAVPINRQSFDYLLMQALTADKARASYLGKIISGLLESGFRSEKKTLQENLLVLASLHDPALAHPVFAHAVVVHALLGARKPPKAAFENATVETFFKDMFSPEGRKALKKQVGNLSSYLQAGRFSPPPNVAHFVDISRLRRTGSHRF